MNELRNLIKWKMICELLVTSITLALGTRVLGTRVLGTRVLGTRVLGTRVLGTRILGMHVFRDRTSEIRMSKSGFHNRVNPTNKVEYYSVRHKRNIIRSDTREILFGQTQEKYYSVRHKRMLRCKCL